MNFTIATFNLKSDRLMSGANRWEHRRERLAAVLHSLGADITAVQELTPRMKRDLAADFPARFLGEGRAGLFDEHTDIAVTSRVKVCRHRTFPLPTGALSVVFPRICTAAELAVGAQRIRVFNTHLDVFSERVRGMQLRFLCRAIARMQRIAPLPTIVTGDFNTPPDSPLIRALTRDGIEGIRLTDTASGIDAGTLHFFRGTGTRRIDYIFADDSFRVLGADIKSIPVGGSFASDHHPVRAVLSLT